MMPWQKFHGKIKNLSYQEAFKVGSSEISLTASSKTTF